MHDYLYVRDLDSGQVVASYFVIRPGESEEDYPADTSHGGVRKESEQDFIEILRRTWAGPRYRIEGGSAPCLQSMVENWEALVDQERPTFESEQEYLCVWDPAARSMVACTLVGDGPNPEGLPTVPRTEKHPFFASLQARHRPLGHWVMEITATSYAEASRILIDWPRT